MKWRLSWRPDFMKPHARLIRGFPKIRGTLLGVPRIRIIAFWDLYWGPLTLGNYHNDGLKSLGVSIQQATLGLGSV